MSNRDEKQPLPDLRKGPVEHAREAVAGSRPATPLATTLAAVALAIVYLAAAWFMAETFALGEPPPGSDYERAASIFAGIQSIGFAAIGALLGVTVQQPRIADARAGENKAKGAIRDVIAPSSSELSGGTGLPPAVVRRLSEGL